MNQRVRHIIILLSSVVLTVIWLVSCRGSGQGVEDVSQRVVLVEIGDSSLYLDEVLSRIPVGISSEDSVSMFGSIVDSWIENLLLTDVAAESSIDMERIERLTSDYRKQLIMSEYRKLGKKERRRHLSDDKIRGYYAANEDGMILEHPLVRGIYLKVSDRSTNIVNLEQMVSHPTRDNIDRLEKEGFPDILEYEYFMDKWVDWESISSQIPYRFFDADAFLESTKDFKTSYNGATYILHISEYVPTGEKMPYEFARDEISEILTREANTDYEHQVIQTLYKRALKDGKLKMVGYDVLKHEMRQ